MRKFGGKTILLGVCTVIVDVYGISLRRIRRVAGPVLRDERGRMDSDFLLIQKMKSGDEHAIDAFVRKYYPMILRYCRLHIGDRGDAEDMTQETFERFFRNFDRYRHCGKAANYLYVIAANACRDYYGKRNAPAMEPPPDEPVCEAQDIEGRLDAHAALNSLPPELRETAVLFFCQELTQKEIAQILGIGIPLVKYRVRRARELLAAYLREEERP